MSIQLQQLGRLCHSPFSGEGVALRPDWEQYRDSQPFVNQEDKTTGV